ncbi:MAG: EFR1 family ferrodoxin [Phascolarctobacterium sp.]|uniref:EFR1 family ferrodoxin n=1 Tax=Phascolarctobacterium sp. TaxID=2049039 RepID=UPI003A101A81
MSDKMEVYYFSPTGGTKKVSDIFAAAVGKDVVWHDLGDKQMLTEQPQGELIIVTAPVFAGRIPSVVREKIKTLAGEGKKAVTIAVYGNRAYEDALLEMNDILKQAGFTVIAAAAFVAQHSIVPEVGTGRPDAEDIKEIRAFAEAVKNSTSAENIHVPGNRPYKPEMKVAAAPLSLSSCTACGVCAKICPTDAIAAAEGKMVTDVSKCILCMACVHACPLQARILPPPLQEKTDNMLAAFRDIRNKNEVFF